MAASSRLCQRLFEWGCYTHSHYVHHAQAHQGVARPGSLALALPARLPPLKKTPLGLLLAAGVMSEPPCAPLATPCLTMASESTLLYVRPNLGVACR